MTEPRVVHDAEDVCRGILGHHPDHLVPALCDPGEPSQVLDVLWSIGAVLIAVVFDSQRSLPPPHVQEGEGLGAAVKDWDLGFRCRKSIVYQQKSKPAFLRRGCAGVDQRQQFA